MENKNNLDGSLWNDMASKIEVLGNLRKNIVWSMGSIVDYIWVVITNLVTLFIVVAIYNSIYESFERITVSLLILIYLTVISVGSTLALGNAKNILMTYSQTKEIRKNSGQAQHENEEFDLAEANFTFEKTMNKFYINSGFNGLIYFIVIIKLLYSL